MEKIEKDGLVAVLVSPGFGAGWSSWNKTFAPVLCMDAEIVQAVIDGDNGKAARIAKLKCGDDLYAGGADQLTVRWIPKGSVFEVEEYDGAESLHIIGGREYMTA